MWLHCWRPIEQWFQDLLWLISCLWLRQSWGRCSGKNWLLFWHWQGWASNRLWLLLSRNYRFCVRVYVVTVGTSFLLWSWTGVNLWRNFLLHNMILLLPSNLTLYCLFGSTSITTYRLNYLSGLFPTSSVHISRGAFSLMYIYILTFISRKIG